jgi:hypothetical protein
MKNFLISSVIVLSLAGCGSPTLKQQVTQLEAGFTSAVSLINDARRPCVLDSEDSPDCLIKADTYTRIAPIVHGADDALDRAKTFAETQQDDEAETWIETVRKYLTNLNTYLDPIKEALGV